MSDCRRNPSDFQFEMKGKSVLRYRLAYWVCRAGVSAVIKTDDWDGNCREEEGNVHLGKRAASLCGTTRQSAVLVDLLFARWCKCALC